MISWWAPARAHRFFSKLLHICLVSTHQFTLKCTWLFVWKRHLLLCVSGRFLYVKCGLLSWYVHDIFRPGENCFSHWLILIYPTQVGFEKHVFHVYSFYFFFTLIWLCICNRMQILPFWCRTVSSLNLLQIILIVCLLPSTYVTA